VGCWYERAKPCPFNHIDVQSLFKEDTMGMPHPLSTPGPPVNAVSTDSNLPAVQGTSQISAEQFEIGLGAGVGVVGASGSGTGIQASSESGVGLQATSNSGNAVSATSTGGIGVYAQGAEYAGQFDGTVFIGGALSIVAPSNSAYAISVLGGDLKMLGGDVLLSGADCAEDFDVVAAAADFGPGTVMVLTENGALQPSRNAYDKKVAGVISGAGDDRPGLILGRCPSSKSRMPLALVGRVYCKADAEYGPIDIGDLLTTSPTVGHAMQAADPAKAFGAVIGKALQPLRSGQGLVRILVALQ
jgi:hypothetical protein